MVESQMNAEAISFTATGVATISASLGASIIAVVSNDPVVIAGAIAAAIVLVMTGAGTMVVQIINARSLSKSLREAAAERLAHLSVSEKTSAMVEDTAKKADAIVTETGKIHELADGTNSNLRKIVEVMTEKVAGQEKVIAELRAAKVDTAAAQALTDQRTALATPAAPVAPVAEVVMVNTKENPANVKVTTNP